MRLSQLFSKTTKTIPADETAKNAKLLIQAGFIHKEMAGVYAYTPLGLMVVENIKKIIREEMNAIGGQELLMSSLQPRDIWEETGRWDDKAVDIWFKTTLQDGVPVGLAWSHEEAIVDMMRQYITSYKDLPVKVYQFQAKLRNELRAKSGIMRGREFLMKDMYSLAASAKQHDQLYEEAIAAYRKVYKRLGIGDDTFFTYASGGAFTQYSHEFQTICEAGEDIIYVDRSKDIAINKEILNEETMTKLGVRRDELEELKTSEVGNIFSFGTDKSQQMGLSFMDENGKRQLVHLGSYGIGVTRVMGVLVEKLADERGIIWPHEVTPAQVYLARLGTSAAVMQAAETVYNDLTGQGVGVLYDDRDERAGEKFADADLMGIPYRLVISDKTVADKQVEIKKRTSPETRLVSYDAVRKIVVTV